MSRLTEIKQRILQLDGGQFQNLCDAYLSQSGYKDILSFGMHPGTEKTKKGIPDTYFRDQEGKYIFVMYTTQHDRLYQKIEKDILDCFDFEKVKVPTSDISEIIYCHTSSNLSAGEDKHLREICEKNKVLLRLNGLDKIADDIYKNYHEIASDFLNMPLDTGQIFNIKDFVRYHDSNPMAAPLSTTFHFREKEVQEVLSSLKKNNVTMIIGNAGVGKTRLALECCEKFANINNYKLLCIKSNELPIYEDLRQILDVSANYLLMIDDANELTGLKNIFQYLIVHQKNFNIKIVLTVREYAKNSVFRSVYEFSEPKIIKVVGFKDTEIIDILKNNLGIMNPDYLNQIVNIAEGNVRIALMAGKLAIKTESLGTIADATHLYEKYYGNFLSENELNKNHELCAVAGVIAFLSTINLENVEDSCPFIKITGLSRERFIECVNKLHELEIVDIYYNKVVKISDQCFGNYLIYFVFIKKRIIAYSNIILNCFKDYESRVINATNILGNVFASESLYNQLKQEIGIVWEQFEKTNDPLFPKFVKAFHFFRPTETLLMLESQIEKLSQNEIDISRKDFSEKSSIVNDDILSILGQFSYNENYPAALDLLLKYFIKQPNKFMECYQTIINSYSITKQSESENYCIQVELVNKFIEYSNHWTNNNACKLFIEVGKQLLKLIFSPAETGRGNQIILYRIPVQFKDGSKKYRESIWSSLLEIYKLNKFNLEIENLIKGYGNDFDELIDKKIIEFDLQNICKFFTDAFTPTNLANCIVGDYVSVIAKREEINLDHEFNSYFCNSDYKIYQILKGQDNLNVNWEKEEELKKINIQNFLEDIDSRKINQIINVCKQVETCDKSNSGRIRDGLITVFDNLSSKPQKYQYLVKTYLLYNTPLDLNPNFIIVTLFKTIGAKDIKLIINNVDYLRKNSWQFSYFANLPSVYITNKTLNELYEYLSMDNRGEVYCRNLEFLMAYEDLDKDVFLKCCKIIDKHSNDQMFIAYFVSLFRIDSKPDKLIDLFKDDLYFLKKVYLKLISLAKNVDIKGNYLIYFSEYISTIIEDYIQLFTCDQNQLYLPDSASRFSVIWNQKNYLQLADKIFRTLFENTKQKSWIAAHTVQYIFNNPYRNIESKDRQDKWISNFIDNNFNKNNLMVFLFKSIIMISSDRRRNHILHLIKLNKDPKLFNELELVSTSWGGVNGSFVSQMGDKISFLKSLLPHLSGLTYLAQKKNVEDRIDWWKHEIEQQQINDLLISPLLMMN
ncbi:hypothetical protein OYT88_14875 [Sporolactobacillus sp. CQH2019]|uniref:nSTAND3 domain-containing NTPase n=1 Tax=Sporolactobacillus sp. CQH2019 TaxID=3023512 RepID=UPI002367D724|nr:hypothetical protein [Sporolactobacillus sp. CQH2019]MDD9149836.1 hypothetical protein [Sporolactobacillus sp. CQH2019]